MRGSQPWEDPAVLDELVGLQGLSGTCWRNLKGPGVLGQGLLKYRWILNLGVKDPWSRPSCCCGGLMDYSDSSLSYLSSSLSYGLCPQPEESESLEASPSACPQDRRAAMASALPPRPLCLENEVLHMVPTETKKKEILAGLMSPCSPVPDPIVSRHRH